MGCFRVADGRRCGVRAEEINLRLRSIVSNFGKAVWETSDNRPVFILGRRYHEVFPGGFCDGSQFIQPTMIRNSFV